MKGRPGIALIQTLKSYQLGWLSRDLSAGLAIAAVGLPSAIAYPAIAGLPPETGLYASILALVGYALFGPSQKLIMGPDAATMIVLAAVLAELPPGAIPERIVLASALALMVGFLCLVARFLRIDVVASFLSRPILTGFMTGISLSILIGQLGRLTGVKIEADGLLRPIIELASKVPLIHWPSLALGLAMLVLLLLIKRIRMPIAIPGPVIVVVLSVLLSVLFDFAGHGISVVGDIPGKFPSLAVPWPLPISLDKLMVDALAVWLVSFSSGIVTARAFGAQGHYRVDANRELSGFAASNVASGLFGGFPVTSSDSRTAINLSVGGKTQLAGLVSAAVLVIVLLYLNPWLRLLPAPALGAILVAAALGLMDISGLARIWRISPIEFVFALVGLIAPILLGVLNGIAIAIGATLTYLLFQGMRPRLAMLGRVKDEAGFHKLHRVHSARPVPGLAVCLVEGSLLFFSIDHVKDKIERLSQKLSPEARWFILDASSIPRLDTTAASALIELAQLLDQKSIKLGIAGLHSEPLALLRRAGVVEVIGNGMVFDSLEDMLVKFHRDDRSHATEVKDYG